MIPFFDGVGAVLTLFHSLAIDLRRRRSAPLICLVADPDSGSWLAEIHNRIQESSPPSLLPHAYLDLAPDDSRHPDSPPLPGGDDPPVLPVLHALFEQLRTAPSGFGYHFRTYAFTDWLTRQTLSAPAGKAQEKELTRRLRDELRGTGNNTHLLLESTPGWFRPLLAVLIVFGPPLRFVLWLSGRVPVPGLVRTRWFMKQQLFPAVGRQKFVPFAVSLTANAFRAPARQTQRERLLIGAFLHDLRLAYRRRLWRPWAWRRTARVLALIDNIAGDPRGEQFLNLLTAVRDHSTPPRGRVTRFLNLIPVIRSSGRKDDPLLLVAGYQVNAIPQPLPRHPLTAANAADACDAWNAPQRPTGAGWRLWLRIPTFVAPPPGVTAKSDARGWGQPLFAPSPPVWARRWVLRSLAVVLVPVFLASVATGILRHGTHFFDPDGCWSRAGVSVSWVDGQCIGYSAMPLN
ncbi:hypothetical protein FsymDg_2158 [Candidatus Protofrankia datiscae]|uniref:Uncharacterized protein n=1 Tax=Candidatus Protofrankia datiscae TaxID=2716812 RepID=F8AYY0_9ACTN|nr:hypothetical protein [Candidatus Protofrankia datiscae]AEH09568.1 hypothetical protein FsymDg_2158 [Candidatus Protofrankia datiscae]